jgi:hypothetical protein
MAKTPPTTEEIKKSYGATKDVRIISGVLNPKREFTEHVKVGERDASFFSIVEDLVEYNSRPNKLAGMRRYKAIVLRVLGDETAGGEEEPSWWASLAAQYKSSPTSSAPKMVKIVAIIPELHEDLPNPTREEIEQEKKEQAISGKKKRRRGTVDMYPIFIAENDEVPKPGVEDIVWVSFENKDTQTGGIYHGPVLGTKTTHKNVTSEERGEDATETPGDGYAAKSSSKIVENNKKLASQYSGSWGVSGAQITEGNVKWRRLKADPEKIGALIKDEYPNSMYFHWKVAKAINSNQKGYHKRAMLYDKFSSHLWRSVKAYVEVGGSGRAISGEVKHGYIQKHYPSFSILAKHIIAMRIAIEDQAGRGYKLGDDSFARAGGVDCDGFVVTSRYVGGFLLAGPDLFKRDGEEENTQAQIRDKIMEEHNMKMGKERKRSNSLRDRTAYLYGMNDTKLKSIVEEIIRDEGGEFSKYLNDSYNSLSLYWWIFRNAHLDRSRKSRYAKDDPIKGYVKSMKRDELTGILFDLTGIARSRKTRKYYVVLDQPYWIGSPKRWKDEQYSRDYYGWRILPRKTWVARIKDYPKRYAKGGKERFSSFDRALKHAVFNAKIIQPKREDNGKTVPMCASDTLSCPAWDGQLSIPPMPGDVVSFYSNQMNKPPGKFPNSHNAPCCASHVAHFFVGPKGELRVAESGGPFSGTGSLTWPDFVSLRFSGKKTFTCCFQQPPEMSGVWLRMKKEAKLIYPNNEDYEGRPTCTWEQLLAANPNLKKEIMTPTDTYLVGKEKGWPKIPGEKKYHDPQKYLTKEIDKEMIDRTCRQVCEKLGGSCRWANSSK